MVPLSPRSGKGRQHEAERKLIQPGEARQCRGRREGRNHAAQIYDAARLSSSGSVTSSGGGIGAGASGGTSLTI